MAAREIEVRRAMWYHLMPDKADRTTETFGGLYNNRTFPRKDLWKGDGFVCVRRGIDSFSVRVLDAKKIAVGKVITIEKGSIVLTCRVVRLFYTTLTEEVKSRNCGMMILSLLSVDHKHA